MNFKRKLIVILCAAVLMLAFTSCSDENGGTTTVSLSGKEFKGDGNVTSSELALSDSTYTVIIENINFESPASGKITINESLDSKVLLKTDGNIAETIDMSLDGGKIIVKGDNAKRYNSTSFEIEIGAAVNDVQINGGLEIDFDIRSITEFTANISGAASGNIQFGQLNDFALTVSGAADIKLSGESQKSVINLSGAGSIEAFEFHTVDSTVEISGAANANIHVTGTLNASISGVGSIIYDGNPETVNDNSGITGTVRAR